MTLDIEPFVGAPPLLFGASADEIAAILGSPRRCKPRKGKGPWVEFSRVFVGFDAAGSADEVMFIPWDYRLSLRGVVLWDGAAITDPISTFKRMDSSFWEHVGFLFFPKLGIITWGIHEEDDSGPGISIQSHHLVSQWKPGLTP